jgi:hypothetical protein
MPDVEPRYAGDSRCAGINPWKPPSYDFPEQPDGFPLDEICRSLLTVDDMVGDLRDEVQAQGRDPIWVFMSDNGMAWGAGGYVMKNVPQAGRLPLYFAGPGVTSGSTSALVSNIDIAPTLAALAGTKMRRDNGKSFVDVLRSERGGRNGMLEDHPVGGETGFGPSGPWWGVRTRDWHLVEWRGTHLYNLDDDPWEMHDVIAGNRDQARELAGRYNRTLSIDQPQPTPTPTLIPGTPTPLPTLSPSATPTIDPATFAPTPPTLTSPTPTPDTPGPLEPSVQPTGPVAVAPTPSPTEPAAQDVVPIGGPGGPSGGLFVFLGLTIVAAIGVVLMVVRPRLRSSA